MADEELVTVTIDDQEVRVPKGTLIWAAAKQIGIEIPIYCYHPKMPSLGACRMCFVEVEKMPKLQTACTTQCTDGMVIRTNTDAVKKGRKGTLEFLLINHPLDCPICDKAGECDLQDFTLRHGPGDSRFNLTKRHYPKPIPVSENILLDRERCILCQRCVRFSQEVAMDNGLIMIDRGYRMEVGTAPGEEFDSVFSGNTVEMCPVGALTAKSFRFRTRPWEIQKTPSVCANCSVGCNVRTDVRIDKVLRFMSRTNDDIDDGWLCDRGRWGFDYINSSERLNQPMIRKNGQLTPVSWKEAISYTAKRLTEIKSQHGAKAIGGIGSTHVTNEEAYLFQKLLREVIGTNNIDHYHGRFPGLVNGKFPWVWSNSIAGLDNASHIFLIEANPYQGQPVIDLRIKKAIRNGAKVYVITKYPTSMDRLAAKHLRYNEGTLQEVVSGMLYEVLTSKLYKGSYVENHAGRMDYWKDSLGKIPASEFSKSTGIDYSEIQELCRELTEAQNAVILYDEMATRDQGVEDLAGTLLKIALATDNFGRPSAGVGPLFTDNNSLGARDMGLLPETLPGYIYAEEPGLNYEKMLGGQVKALMVLGANPVLHADAPEIPDLTGKVEFVVVQEMFMTETAKNADVVFPVLSSVEKDGTFTNTDRHIQRVKKGLRPLPGAKADWEILTLLARDLGAEWSYRKPADILAEIAETVEIYRGISYKTIGEYGVQWPLIEGEGQSYLTLDMLETGFEMQNGENDLVLSYAEGKDAE